MSYLYPYGDTQQLNLSWFLAKFRELYEYVMQLDPTGSGADIAEILARFTEQYDSTKNYIPGDYCIHDGYIYKANTTTTGIFDAGAWDPALPVNDVQGLRILLGGLSTDLTALEQNAVTNTQYTPGAATADGLLRQTKNGTAETVMTVDKEPTANSQNPVKSGAVQAGIAAVSQAVGSERTDRQNADNSLQDQIDELNDITGDGVLSGFTATDLTGAANELKGSLTSEQTARQNADTALQNAIGDLSSSDISDDSDAGGATVKASLNNLKDFSDIQTYSPINPVSALNDVAISKSGKVVTISFSATNYTATAQPSTLFYIPQELIPLSATRFVGWNSTNNMQMCFIERSTGAVKVQNPALNTAMTIVASTTYLIP